MTMSDQIIQVLDALCEKFGIVIDWTSANVIPYLTTLMGKLVQWEIWSSVAWIVFAVIGTVVCVVLFILSIKRFDEWDIFTAILIPIAVIGGLIAISVLVMEIMDIIKCLTFPEMFVFEYIQNLISYGS